MRLNLRVRGRLGIQLVGLLFLGLLLSIGFPLTKASAAFPGENGRVAFAIQGGIGIIAPDGTERVIAKARYEPEWSADGSTLATGGGGIDLWEESGKFIRSVELEYEGEKADAAQMAWSPDGDYIAFIASYPSDETFDIYRVELATGDVIELTTDVNSGLAWSPDGSKIAFSHFDLEGGTGIYTMDPDGDNVALLTEGPDCLIPNDPDWSPDGEEVVFGAGGYTCESEFVLPSIHAVGNDGTGLREIYVPGGQWRPVPVWSPDGTKIAFITDADDDPSVDEPRVFSLDLITEEVEMLSDRSATGSVDWQVLTDYVDPAETSTSLKVRRSGDSFVVTGSVSPAVQTGDVAVKLLKKRDGKFRRVRQKVGALDAESSYRVSIKRTGNGKCKIISTFKGNDEASSSRASKMLDC